MCDNALCISNICKFWFWHYSCIIDNCLNKGAASRKAPQRLAAFLCTQIFIKINLIMSKTKIVVLLLGISLLIHNITMGQPFYENSTLASQSSLLDQEFVGDLRRFTSRRVSSAKETSRTNYVEEEVGSYYRDKIIVGSRGIKIKDGYDFLADIRKLNRKLKDEGNRRVRLHILDSSKRIFQEIYFSVAGKRQYALAIPDNELGCVDVYVTEPMFRILKSDWGMCRALLMHETLDTGEESLGYRLRQRMRQKGQSWLRWLIAPLENGSHARAWQAVKVYDDECRWGMERLIKLMIDNMNYKQLTALISEYEYLGTAGRAVRGWDQFEEGIYRYLLARQQVLSETIAVEEAIARLTPAKLLQVTEMIVKRGVPDQEGNMVGMSPRKALVEDLKERCIKVIEDRLHPADIACLRRILFIKEYSHKMGELQYDGWYLAVRDDFITEVENSASAVFDRFAWAKAQEVEDYFRKRGLKYQAREATKANRYLAEALRAIGIKKKAEQKRIKEYLTHRCFSQSIWDQFNAYTRRRKRLGEIVQERPITDQFLPAVTAALFSCEAGRGEHLITMGRREDTEEIARAL